MADIEFNENLSSGRRSDICGENDKDGRADRHDEVE